MVGDQCALHFRGPDIVPGDNDDIIRPSEYHDIAVLAFDREVTDRVDPVYGVPVLAIALVIFVYRAQHGRPR